MKASNRPAQLQSTRQFDDSADSADSADKLPLEPILLDSLWDFGDPAASEQRFRQALDDVGSRSCCAAELNTQLARSLGLQSQFDQATVLLDTVEESAQTLPAVVGVRLSLERGRVLNSSGYPAAATEHFHRALVLAEGIGNDFLAVDAAHMLAIADPDRAAEWTERALRTVRSSTDPRTALWGGSLHNNAGWARHDTGDFAGALDEFEAALAAYAGYGTADQVRVAQWAIARALRSLGRFDEALQIQYRLDNDGPADGYVKEELAELLVATQLGADSWYAEHEPDRLERLRTLSGAD